MIHRTYNWDDAHHRLLPAAPARTGGASTAEIAVDVSTTGKRFTELAGDARDHQSILGEIAYGFDRDGAFWAISAQGQASPIERDDIPEGQPIRDLDGFFIEPIAESHG